MKYWTVQSFEAWQGALGLGYLQGNLDYIWEDFLPAYKWMMREMKLRLESYTGEYPIWIWPKRPDLRCSGILNKGTKGVLLEIILNDYEVLLSDFQAWHIVLSNSFLSLTEEEEVLYEMGKVNMSLEESWTRIFDYKGLQQYDNWQGEIDLQGVTGQVPLGKIKLVKTFIAR